MKLSAIDAIASALAAMMTMLPLQAHASPASQPLLAPLCVSDLDFIPSFLVANDAGASDRLAQIGNKALQQALADASKKAESTESDQSCLDIINDYLKTWRPGHLWAAPMIGEEPSESKRRNTAGRAGSVSAQPPTLRWLSSSTALLTIPSFSDDAKAPLDELLQHHQKKLAATPNWMIAIRQNSGGSDSTYSGLLDLIVINPRQEIGVGFLSTPANIENTERVCAIYAPHSQSCKVQIGQLTKAMRAGDTGSFVKPPGMDDPVMKVSAHRPAGRAPRRVAVLIDQHCASSCEQFLLSVRQSYNVKLFGRRTSGVLDYSNLRPQALPSGSRMLWYATSRSFRLPHFPVDAAGIAPDIYLPPPQNDEAFADEVRTVRGFLEKSAVR